MSFPMLPTPDRRRPSRRVVALVVCCALAAGCATTGLRRGRAAEQRQDYDLAVVEYNNALRQHPDNVDLRLALGRAKVRAGQDHFEKGRRLSAIGKLDEALVEYQTASELN